MQEPLNSLCLFNMVRSICIWTVSPGSLAVVPAVSFNLRFPAG